MKVRLRNLVDEHRAAQRSDAAQETARVGYSVRAAAATAGATAAALALAAGAHASTIVYPCNANICAVDPDGSQKRQLTSDGTFNGGHDYGDPRLSRTGLMTFTFKSGLYIADARAKHRHRVAVPKHAPGGALPPVVSGDGRELTYLFGIFAGPATAYRACRISTAPGARPKCGKYLNGAQSAWSWGPGRQLLTYDEQYRQSICITSLNGTCKRVIVHLDDSEETFFQLPDLSPDGRTLAIDVNHFAGSEQITLFDPGSGRRLREVTRGHDDQAPVWSPSGRALVFQRDNYVAAKGTESSICWVGARGGKVRCPVRNGANLGRPTWGP